MCGICGFLADNATRPSAEGVAEMFAATEARGKDASGFAASVSGKLWRYRAPHKSSRTVSLVNDLLIENAKTWIGHCRLATHGSEKNNENNHPFVYGGLALVHNGIIYNYDNKILSNEYSSLKSDCDSEMILHSILRYRSSEKSIIQAIRKMAEVLNGDMACALISKKGHLWVWRRESFARQNYVFTPLIIATSSDVPNVHFASVDAHLKKSLHPGKNWDINNLANGVGVHFWLQEGKLHHQKFDVPECKNTGYYYAGGWGDRYDWNDPYPKIKQMGKVNSSSLKKEGARLKTCPTCGTMCRLREHTCLPIVRSLVTPGLSERLFIRETLGTEYSPSLPEDLIKKGVQLDRLYTCEDCLEVLLPEELEIHRIEFEHITYIEEDAGL